MTFMMFFTVLFLLSVALVWMILGAMTAAITNSVEKVLARHAKEFEARQKAAKEAAEKAIAGMESVGEFDEDEDGEEEDEDVCLSPGMKVRCNLSDCTHTHGTLLGFAMSPDPTGPMLAIVTVGVGIPVMSIDVDRVDPEEGEGDEGGGIPLGYRDNAKPTSKNWN